MNIRHGNLYVFIPSGEHFLFTGEYALKTFHSGKWQTTWMYISDITTYPTLFKLVGINLKTGVS